MTIDSTKTQLVQLLNDKENKVIALTGRWGTGKSHLWDNVKQGSTDHSIKSSVYVSLFGLSDMTQLKLKIVQSALPKSKDYPATWEGFRNSVAGIRKALKIVHEGFSVLDDLALLVLPALYKNRLIVIDDIERKHDKLSIDEVLGFIDECTNLYASRVVLILNSDQLVDLNIWEKLREKVVDQEISMAVTPSEAFDVAISLTPSLYAERVKRSIIICGLTNIRIIRKVIKAINRILGNRNDLTDDVLNRTIPSTVLLSSIHYKGIENGPNFDFVLNYGSIRTLKGGKKLGEDNDEATENSKIQWKHLLRLLGINHCDEFENIVIDYLNSGMFDANEVDEIVDRYVSEADVVRAQKLATQFREHMSWHHRLNDVELLQEAQNLIQYAALLNASDVTMLNELIQELPDSQTVADELIDKWVEAFVPVEGKNFDVDRGYHNRWHPRIKKAFEAAINKSQGSTSIIEALKYISEHKSWGKKQTSALAAVKVKYLEGFIKTAEYDDMKFLMCQLLDMNTYRDTYEPYFESVMHNFIAACRNIYNNPDSGRLGKLIYVLFEEANLEEELKIEKTVPD